MLDLITPRRERHVSECESLDLEPPLFSSTIGSLGGLGLSGAISSPERALLGKREGQRTSGMWKRLGTPRRQLIMFVLIHALFCPFLLINECRCMIYGNFSSRFAQLAFSAFCCDRQASIIRPSDQSGYTQYNTSYFLHSSKDTGQRGR